MMSIAAFARHLRVRKEAILQQWQSAVFADPEAFPSAQGLPEPQFRDNLPCLLEKVAIALEGGPLPPVDADGRDHGRHRWGSGYDLAEMLREITEFREVLMAVVEEYAGDSPGLTRAEEAVVRRRIRQATDQSAQAGAGRFHAEALVAHRLLEAELEAVNEKKDRFVAILAHELRNPLSPILTAVQLLEFTEAADPRIRRAREIIERQVRHQTRLIDDLLDVSRVASGKIALRLEIHDLKRAVKYAIDSALPAIESKGQTLQVQLPDEPLMVNADPVRLEQVVTNLLMNANKYTDAAGVIELGVDREAGKAVVRVRDSGIGIRPEFLPRVFDLFAQSDTSPGRDRGGLGIGLTLVKHLVELHSGTVEAHSAGLGMGSEFVFRLPLIEGDVAASPAPDPPARLPTTRRIAVVEDDPDSSDVLRELLQVLGHQVVTAANGPEALRLAEESAPEVFLVDIGLPGMDGYELARALRRIPAGEQALLIAVSGYGGGTERERARQAGFNAHILKPADIEEIQRLLTRGS